MRYQEQLIQSDSFEETQTLAVRFAKLLRSNDVIALYGNLGSGKTAFTAGIAKGLGIYETIPSPTFTILIEHESAAIPLYHFDAYRLSSANDFSTLGFEEYFDAGGVCVVEWADKIKKLFPSRTIHIDIRQDFLGTDSTRRSILFRFPGEDERMISLFGKEEE
jgi:tRNA threonylcarbamoyladenosine biosynthesis protein TsaE